MKTALLSLATALTLFVTTAASAATTLDPGRDLRRMSPIERARYERAERENERRQAQERARYEAAQRKLQAEQQRRQAQERARWEAQHRNDRHDDHGYHGR